MKKFIYITFGLMVIAVTNCTKPYNPPAINAPATYLVVEGVISDTTTIRLSNTVNLSSIANLIPVLGARVTVAGNNGSSFTLTETGNGYYQGTSGLNAAGTYQLKIVTADNQSYASDFVPVKNAPVIDSVTYAVKSSGVQIYASTHDPSNNSRYYRWSYRETYIIHSKYASDAIVETVPTDTIVIRAPQQQIYECWVTDSASNIILGSSAKLAQDVIQNQPITLIPNNSEKLGDLYSILVEQYTLTADAFNYWEELEDNSTNLGTIFSAQPSQLTGNMHCTSNPAQVVIGYISAGLYTQKRIFVDSRNLSNWIATNPYGSCQLDSFYFSAPVTKENQVLDYIYHGSDIPVSPITTMTGVLLGYSASSPFCVDCTLRGTNVKPSFFPY